MFHLRSNRSIQRFHFNNRIEKLWFRACSLHFRVWLKQHYITTTGICDSPLCIEKYSFDINGNAVYTLSCRTPTAAFRWPAWQEEKARLLAQSFHLHRMMHRRHRLEYKCIFHIRNAVCDEHTKCRDERDEYAKESGPALVHILLFPFCRMENSPARHEKLRRRLSSAPGYRLESIIIWQKCKLRFLFNKSAICSFFRVIFVYSFQVATW